MCWIFHFQTCLIINLNVKTKVHVGIDQLKTYFIYRCTATSDLQRPIIDEVIGEDNCLSKPFSVFTLDMKTVSTSELENISKEFEICLDKSTRLHGMASWFQTEFCGLDPDVETSYLNTGPNYP